MPMQELDEFWNDTFEVPIRGKVYRIPSPDAETGLWCQQMFELGAVAQSGRIISDRRAEKLNLDDDEEVELYDRVLGPVKQEMIDDGLSWARVAAVAQTAIIWIATNRETAEKYWNEQVVGGGPKAPAPRQPQDHKPSAKRTGTTRSSRQGSPAGSKPRKNNTAPQASAGPTSSTTGS